MIRNILRVMVITLSIIGFSAPAFAADDAQVVNSFKQFCDDNIAKVTATYEGTHYSIAYQQPSKYTQRPESWIKYSGIVDPNYKYDVQKTNSLVSPYIGTLEVTYKTVVYKDFPTKEAAEATNDIVRYTPVVYKFIVAYQDDKWVVTDAKKYNSVLGEWFTLDTKDIFVILKCEYDAH